MRYKLIRKQIPRTLEDCTKDETASKVQKWADRMDDWGAVVCFLLVVVGLIIAFLAAGMAKKASNDASALTFFLTFLPWCIGAVAAHFAFQIAAVVLEAIASITLNTAVSTNLALYEATQKRSDVSTETQEGSEAPQGEIKE